MTLWLIRHADALDGPDDAARELSLKGRRQAEALGALLGRLPGDPPDELWHSPLVRARQTAEMVKESAKWAAPIAPVKGLLPCDEPVIVAERLRSVGRVALVGHNPHITRLASWLVAGDPEADAFDVRKATAIGLELAPHPGEGTPRWSVAWMLSPDLVMQ